MNCRQVIRAINAQLEEMPIGISVEKLEEHLAGCERCRAEKQRLEEVSRLLRASSVRVTAPDGLADEIWSAIQDHRAEVAERRVPFGGWLGWRQALAGAACVAVLFVAIARVWQPGAGVGNLQVAKIPSSPIINKATVEPPTRLAPAIKPARRSRPAEMTPKPVVVPGRPKKNRVIYYAMAPSYLSKSVVAPRVRTIARPEDYVRVARCITNAQQTQVMANAEVQEQLEKTTKIIGRAYELIKNAVEEPTPPGGGPATTPDTPSSYHREALGG